MASVFTIQIIGFDKFQNRLEKIAAEAFGAGSQAMRREAEGLLADAQAEVPVKTGELYRSGRVTQANFGGNTIVATVRFGGANVPYALYVHEDLTKHHPVGKAKFLEDPFNRRLQNFLGRLGTDLQGTLFK